MDKKDERIIKKAKDNNIPIFVIIADDKLCLDGLYPYLAACQREKCSKVQIDGVEARVSEFETYQNENLDKIKLPN